MSGLSCLPPLSPPPVSTPPEEITGLHDKIDRVKQQEENNLKVAVDMQQDCSAKCTEFEQGIGRNQGIQQVYHADIQDQLEKFHARSTAELTEMRQQVCPHVAMP